MQRPSLYKTPENTPFLMAPNNITYVGINSRDSPALDVAPAAAGGMSREEERAARGVASPSPAPPRG